MLLLAGGAVAGETSKYCSKKADNVVVYIDRTTPYDDIDKKDLIDGVSRLFETLKGGERFSMRTIADNFAASTNLLDECLPGVPCGRPVRRPVFRLYRGRRHQRQEASAASRRSAAQGSPDQFRRTAEFGDRAHVGPHGAVGVALREGRTGSTFSPTSSRIPSTCRGRSSSQRRMMCFSGTSPRMGWFPIFRAPLCRSSESVAAAILATAIRWTKLCWRSCWISGGAISKRLTPT